MKTLEDRFVNYTRYRLQRKLPLITEEPSEQEGNIEWRECLHYTGDLISLANFPRNLNTFENLVPGGGGEGSLYSKI